MRQNLIFGGAQLHADGRYEFHGHAAKSWGDLKPSEKNYFMSAKVVTPDGKLNKLGKKTGSVASINAG